MFTYSSTMNYPSPQTSQHLRLFKIILHRCLILEFSFCCISGKWAHVLHGIWDATPQEHLMCQTGRRSVLPTEHWVCDMLLSHSDGLFGDEVSRPGSHFHALVCKLRSWSESLRSADYVWSWIPPPPGRSLHSHCKSHRHPRHGHYPPSLTDTRPAASLVFSGNG